MAISRVTSGKNNNFGTGYQLDATGSTVNTLNQTTGGTTTLSFTVGSGSNRLLIVSISFWNNGGTAAGCSGITYGGTAMTKVTGSGQNSAGGKFYTEQWYLVAPTSGTANIVATVGGQCDKLGLSAISFAGVNQTTPIDTNTSAAGTSGSVTASLTTTYGSEYLVDCVSHLSANNPSSNSNTSIYTDAASGTSTSSQYGLSGAAGSNSMTWTYPDPGDEWAYSVLAVNPIINYQANDLLVILAFDATANTVPSTPSGWTSLSSAQQSAAGCAMAIFYKYATGFDAYPTISNATASTYAIYRGVHQNSPFTGTGGQSSSSAGTSISYSGIASYANPGADWVLTFGTTNVATSAVGSVPPTSMTLLQETTGSGYDIAMFDSNAALSSYSFNSKTLSASSTWMTKTTEMVAAPALGTSVYAQSTSYNSGASISNTGTLKFNTAPAVGDILVVGMSYAGAKHPSTAPSGWTQIDDLENGTSAWLTTYYHIVGSNEFNSYTFSTNAGDYLSIGLLEMISPATTSIINQHAIATGSANPQVTPNVTPSLTNCIAVAFVAYNDGTGMSSTAATAGTGWTMDQNPLPSFHSLVAAHRNSLTSDTTTAINASITWGTGDTDVSSTILIATTTSTAPASGSLPKPFVISQAVNRAARF